MAQPSETEFALFLTAGISITFILAASIILFVVFYQKRLFAHQLKLKKLESEHRKKLLEVSIQAQEKERKRIASDLHDEVGALLSTTKLYLSHLEQSPNPVTVGNKIEGIIDEAQKNLKNILNNITPQNLEQFGLISAVQEVCNRINDAHLLHVNFEFNDEKRLASDQEIGLYRITQELLNNTMKHAGASEAKIHFNFMAQQLLFNYQDNGRGMNLQTVVPNTQSGLGLQNIRSRVELMNGSVYFESTPDEGFKAKLVLIT